MPVRSNSNLLEMSSSLPLVSYWPDEDEKHYLEKYYATEVYKRAEGSDLLVRPEHLAGGVKHLIRKRSEEAAHSARADHPGKRAKVMRDDAQVRHLQELSAETNSVRRIRNFLSITAQRSAELHSRVRVGEQGLFDDTFTTAARSVVRGALDDDYVLLDHLPDITAVDVPGNYVDTYHREMGVDIDAKKRIATFVSEKKGTAIEVKTRGLGAVSLTLDGLQHLESLYLGSKGFEDKSADHIEFDFPEFKDTLRTLIQRDAMLPYDERLIEPTLSVIYICRVALEKAID
jgi:hypothetical protein